MRTLRRTTRPRPQDPAHHGSVIPTAEPATPRRPRRPGMPAADSRTGRILYGALSSVLAAAALESVTHLHVHLTIWWH